MNSRELVFENTDQDRTWRIRDLNDTLRTTGVGGRILMTAGIAALAPEQIVEILAAVATFSNFNSGNDPHGEHDCATLSAAGQNVIWKIDYYDRSLSAHSPDPADPALTVRVLTVMLGDEY
jgi:hypothetical protein